jgi:large repetitive protein
MFGDPGNDKLYGWPGEDAMQGEEGTDEHYGGKNDDFIDAADNEQTPDTDAPDLVDCGSGFDTALVLPNDIVRDNCEDVTDVSATPVAASGTTGDEGQQRQRKAFLHKRGG